MKQHNLRIWIGVGLLMLTLSSIVWTLAEPTLAEAPPQLAAHFKLPVLPEIPFNYANVALPPYFNNPNIANADNTPLSNPVTDDGATLGRVLFYDVQLSANDTVACASCHLQENGFSDPSQFSVGFQGGLTGRNSMSLLNSSFYSNGHFFWDERADTLEDQVLMPIQDSVEMGMELTALESKLAAVSYYPPLFEAAFGTDEVNSERISLALAQFIRSIVSFQSRFDQGIPQNFANLNDQENLGRQIFSSPQGACSACHGTDIQIATRARNNGLDAVTTDPGLGTVTGSGADDGKFKVPSLRNIELTAPYMHDGRFETLEQVVDFYNNGVQPHPNLDSLLELPNGQPRQLNLTKQERNALVAFLRTLTDPTIANEVRWSDPFEPFSQLFLPILNRP